MTTPRSNWPSRIRELISDERTIGLTINLDSQPPPKIKAFTEKVIHCPLQDIAIPLSGFRWEYSKGNFHHWGLLLLHFDAYFKAYLACRNDLTLSDNLHDDSPLPKHGILQILRVIQIILENCPNKSSFDGLEHFKLLLASSDPEILLAALETLSALVKINPFKLHGSAKIVGCGSMNSYLLSLAQGWGSKEEGLGLYSCVMANEKAQDEALCLFPFDVDNGDDQQSNHCIGSTLYFELHGLSSQSKEHSLNTVSPSFSVIHMPDLHRCKEDDLSLMKQCIEQHAIPPDLRFSLLTRIRYAHAFRSPKICRLYSRVCLLSFIVLVQSGDADDELLSFFDNEPEYTNELIRVVRSEEMISGSIRTLAMLALVALLAAYISWHERGRIPNGSSISFSGGNHMILLNVLQRAIFSLKSSNDPSSLAFTEALLQFYLLRVVSTSTSGSNVRGSGMVPTFLPLLEDYDPGHIHLVCFAVKILQKLMDYSSSAVSFFQELGVIELLVQRLQKDVHGVIGLVEETDNNMMLTGESSRHCTNQLYSQKRLIKVSLKALGFATYAPANATRSQHSQGSSLPETLVLIFGNVDKFGGGIYYSAVTVMSKIIHKDPTCFSAIHVMGLPDAFLSSIESGILPSSKALTCVPNGLGAICLNAKGLEAVRASSSLQFLVDIFTSKKYVLAINEAIIPISNSVEELLRRVSSLRSTGVDIIIEIIQRIASFGGGAGTGSPGKANEDTTMETNAEVKANKGHCGPVGTSLDSSSEVIKNENFIQLGVFHLLVLVHRTMENSEMCQLFVEKSGIEALLKLLLQPTIAQSSGGMSIAFHSTMVFKEFAKHHSTPLARAFCSSLKENLKKTLAGFGAASEPLLLDPRMTSNNGIFSSLFHVEFLHFLAASKDSCWLTALLTELGNGSKDVLEDIGHVHREVLWQIALLENTKTEVDPLLRRRASGWSIESQFVDPTNLYLDLGCSAGSQHGPSSVGHSYMQSCSNNQLQHSGSDDNVGTTNKKESDKQRTYYNSCYDMVKSLSFHITHLFQELGKVMLLPSHLDDDIVSASPASKSVASTFTSIILDHMKFGAHVNISGTEASISTKCRYFGKMIDFMDSILMERPDSCNPILLNYLYGRGVIQSVLTSFEATGQLLFAVNHAPASPMDTHAKQDDKAWIYCSLASYGKLMDHLVTSSFILSSFTNHLLTQPLTNGNTPLPQDAGTFVKVLQSTVLKTVLPVWTHPQFVDCKMGFSRSRAEEALRQVGSNSVELAMEWLFSHPDDELARALAMSLGNSESDKNDAVANGSAQQIEEEMVQLPPIDELLSTCTKLLLKESLTLPVSDLLVMICSQDGGQYRFNVVIFIVDRIKECGLISSNVNDILLAALFHVLALILNEDTVAREAASKSGLIKIASDLLYQWDSCLLDSREKQQVPKWIKAVFLALDRLLQVAQELNSEIVEPLKEEVLNSQKTSITLDEDRQNKLQSALGLSIKYEQKRLVEVACSCMKNQLPLDTMHAVLLLCSNLTRNHSVALTFLDAGGLSLLLSLPTSSLNLGFDSIAASIVRHILEDPQTLQQTMESEIKHSLVVASNQHPNVRVNPRNFLVNLSSVISRDPAVFMQAAQAVCQVELVGERPYVVLLKDRDKDKTKKKEKDKDKSLEKDKAQSDGMVGLGNTNNAASGNGHGKLHKSSAKSVKGHRKPTQSFTNVVELLLEPIYSFVPPLKDEIFPNNPGIPASSDMDIDVSTVKGKGKAVSTMSEGNESISKEASASLVKIVFILELLAEVLLIYPASVHVLLRRDAKMSSIRGTFQKSPTGLNMGGIFYHILHNVLPCSRNFKDEKGDGDWRQKLAPRANQFMIAACIRSSEAMKRVFSEISYIINEFVDLCDGVKLPGNEIQVFVDLLNNVLAARTPAGSSISAEASATFIDLELVSKEHVHSVESNAGKGDSSTKPSDQANHESLQVDHVGSYNAIQSYGGPEAVTDDMENDQDLDETFARANEDVHENSEDVRRGFVNEVENVGLRFEIQPHGQENLDEDDDVDDDTPEDDVDEDGHDDAENNDLEDGVHHLPHPDTDQDDHEVDDEDEVEDEDGVIMRLEEGVNGINVFDHAEVFGRDNSFVSETFHVMPAEVFGSRRPGRTTSIYSLLGRTSDTATPSLHPLLVEPSSSFPPSTVQSG
ncbi:putative aminoacyltransferase, E1 ubiquitin-activating enzyme [Lupinus albus]|uniref:Putative aminoacyltransferase, E1 ubiquitin-activating enzyme n=1 Tax=Lupinus albus TaxID=3870 RepID=A0A6A4QLQ7_LUPAL|nr:putative aminoacyltransferase, E1 ubiquitin-activating enzyme [Lupinus albus]